MAGTWSLAAGFFLFVTFIQVALGYFLIVRRPRSEWSWIVGALFILNGTVSLQSFAQEYWGNPSTVFDFIARGTNLLDPMTTVLIILLALVFPRPIPIMRRHGAWVRLLLLAPFPVFYAFADLLPAVPAIAPYDLRSLIGFVAIPELAWILVLGRWSHHLLRERSPVRAEQFRYVFAAFGVRAANLGVYEPIRIFLIAVRDGFTAGIGIALVLFMAHVLALLYALYMIQRVARTGHAVAVRSALFVGAFLAIGIIEGAWTLLAQETGLSVALFNGFDLFVVRPALIWVAVVRTDFLDIKVAEPRGAIPVVAGLAFIVVLFAARPSFPQLGGLLNWGAAGFTAASVALVLGAVCYPLVRREPEVLLGHPARAGRQGPSGRQLGVLVDALEEMEDAPHAKGRAARARSLAERYGVSDTRQRALRDAVAHQWDPNRAPAEWVPGETIVGRYQIRGLLAAGGAGNAYRADDVVTGLPVVLKRTRQLEPDARAALLREAHVVTGLQHPGIVPLIDIPRAGTEPILVFPYLEGGSLSGRLVAEPKMTAEQTAVIARTLLAALGVAHNEGVVHRDVKPANILLDAKGNAHLADFGVARSPDGPAALGDPTRTGWQPGTLRYMAPEQVEGLPVSAATDLYAVGAVLYECLTGMGLVDPNLSDYEQQRAIVERTPNLRRRGIPTALRPVLKRALEKDPSRRYPTAASMALAIEDAIIPR